LTITAATFSAGSKRSKPSTVAAALRDWRPHPRRARPAPQPLAICAVEPASLVPSMPSEAAHHPSTIATSASAARRATVASTTSRPHIRRRG